MAISPPSSAKTHSLVSVLCFIFSISSSLFLLLCSLFCRPHLLVVVGSVLYFLISFIKSYDLSQTVCVDLIFFSNLVFFFLLFLLRHESGNWRFVLFLRFRWTVFFFLYVFLWTVTITLTHHLTLTGYICSSTVWHGSS